MNLPADFRRSARTAAVPEQIELRLVDVLGGADAVFGSTAGATRTTVVASRADRPFQGMQIEDVLDGQRRMDALADGWQLQARSAVLRLPSPSSRCSRRWGSTACPPGLRWLTLELEHVREANAELDLFDLTVRRLRVFSAAEAEPVRLLSTRRLEDRHYQPVGILTHHIEASPTTPGSSRADRAACQLASGGYHLARPDSLFPAANATTPFAAAGRRTSPSS